MKAVKGNKIYNISDSQKKSYQDAGFDILDGEGKTVAYGRGKTVPYEEYAALQKTNAALQEENEVLRAKIKELEKVSGTKTSGEKKGKGSEKGGE